VSAPFFFNDPLRCQKVALPSEGWAYAGNVAYPLA
jgi:hypothetical protein